MKTCATRCNSRFNSIQICMAALIKKFSEKLKMRLQLMNSRSLFSTICLRIGWVLWAKNSPTFRKWLSTKSVTSKLVSSTLISASKKIAGSRVQSSPEDKSKGSPSRGPSSRTRASWSSTRQRRPLMSKARKLCNRRWTELWKAALQLWSPTDSALSATATFSLCSVTVKLWSKGRMTSSQTTLIATSTSWRQVWKTEEKVSNRERNN